MVDTEGDALFVAFRSASEAIAGAIAGQQALAEHDWGETPRPQVRMGWSMGLPDAAHKAVKPFDGFHRGVLPKVLAT